jgi:hypothetical protein
VHSTGGVAPAVGQPFAIDGYRAKSSRACKVLAGAVGEASSVGVVLVISVVQAELLLPEELMQASTELASVLMSARGTVTVTVEPLATVVLANPVVGLTRFAAFRKACAKPEAAQPVVIMLGLVPLVVQAAVAALLLAGALMLTVVELGVMLMKPLSA